MTGEQVMPEDYAYANITDKEAEEISHDNSKSWGAIIPKIAICIKTTVVILILLQVFVAWYKLKDDIKS